MILVTEKHKMEIIHRLHGILRDFVATEGEPELTMFGLIRRYNAQNDNPELIGGDWVLEHTDIRLPEYSKIGVVALAMFDAYRLFDMVAEPRFLTGPQSAVATIGLAKPRPAQGWVFFVPSGTPS